MSLGFQSTNSVPGHERIQEGPCPARCDRARKVRALIKRDFETVFAEDVDAILTPATPSASDPLGLDGPKEDTTTIVEMKGGQPKAHQSVIYEAVPLGSGASVEIDKGSARASGVHLPPA